MSTTLAVQSFSEINLRERTSLRASVTKGSQVLEVESSANYTPGETIFVGALSREGCEKAVVLLVPESDTINLVAPLKYDHGAFDNVTAVLGDVIHIRRAPNVDGQVPANELFAHLTYRTINSEAQMTFYTDPDGTSAHWYRATYFNATTNEETDLDASVPTRGDDFGHYASLTAIRAEAGFQNATRLSDGDVDQQRRLAESEINATLGTHLTVPFVKPIPEIITTITIKLAAGFLLNNAYGKSSRIGDDKIKDARALMAGLSSGSTSTGDLENQVASGVSGDFGDGERLFNIGDEY